MRNGPIFTDSLTLSAMHTRIPEFRYNVSMARRKTPDGRRNGISAKFSDAELAEILTAAGGTPPGTWLREASLSVARGKEARHTRRDAARQANPSLRKKPDAAVDAAIAEDDERPFLPLVREDCPHPKARILKGLCRVCGTYVGG